ncbi:peptidoglycan DD-metalloendopeptidase family protein [Desulfotomaculum varum]
MQLTDKLKSLLNWLAKQPKTYKQGISVLLAVVLVLSVVFAATNNGACAVAVDGQVVAVVKSKAAAEAVVNSLVKEHQAKAANVKLQQQVTYKTAKDLKSQVISEEELKQLLSQRLTFEGMAAGIQVNGSLKVAVKDKATADQLLENLKQSYSMGPDYKVNFQEKVEVVEVPVRADKILDPAAALKRLRGESATPRYYTVKEGDTLWDIALKCKVSPDDLIANNPGFEPEKMQIGQKIKMVGVPDPIINVVAVAEKTVKEEIAAAQQVRKNAKLPFGKTVLVQKGETGLKEVTYKIIAVNGLETERQVLQEKILKQAKPQIIERSAQTMVASRGYRPGGAILSPFGMRNGRMHTGVDLARPYGSPVGAYNEGRVIRAGWYGGYGKCVDISHGNGIVTRYAHLSSINVSVGETVQRGQKIGAVGSTGRSSGPHLHFEVIVNGVPKNPLGYI